MNNPQEQAEFRSIQEDVPFHFACHQGIPCFTQCCARLRLILGPYDIVRVKRRLGLLSDEFLQDYTETFIDRRYRFSMVTLKMNGDSEGACPFVTKEGCAIYEDRPEACRLYPVGRASASPDGTAKSAEAYFMIQEPHCQGFREQRTWTLEEWLDHEGVREYAAMNEPWRGIVTSSRTLGPSAHIAQKHQMFFMASYNLDKFRDFIFKSRFFYRFEIDSDMKNQLKTDDVVLMHFAFNWLRFSLFGEKSMPVTE